MSQWLQEKSWKEAQELVNSSGGVAILPVGSVEQHGYHMPLGCDTYVAMMIAEDAAEQTGAALVPPVWFGWSPHHMVLPGTITVRPEVLIELVFDIAGSLKKHGFDKILIVNGHRIVNVVWMQLAAEKIQRETGAVVKIFDPAYMSKDIVGKLGFGAVGHAEEVETSHMLYRHPEMVHLELAKDNPILPQELYSVDPAYSHDTLCYVPSSYAHAEKNAQIAGGTTGEPTKSDPQKGEQYHRHLVERMVAVIKALQKG